MADPPVPAPSAEATLHKIHKADEKQGATVHSFDPDASPEEKARTVGKAAAALKPDGFSTANVSEGRGGFSFPPSGIQRFSPAITPPCS